MSNTFTKTRKLDKKNFDALSIADYDIKKNLLRGAKHGASERQRIYKTKAMLQKTRQPNHGGYKNLFWDGKIVWE